VRLHTRTGIRLRLRSVLALGLFAAHLAIFWAIFHWGLVSDLQVHARIARVGLETGTWWGTPLPYFSAAAVGGFRVDQVDHGLILVLGIAVAAKYLVSVAIAERELPSESGRSNLHSPAAIPSGLLALIALLSFAFSLPTDSMYIGQLPPNVFHNSTVVFLMPFALALFWFSAQFLRRGDNRSIVGVALSGALNVAAKPSFVFPLLVIFPLAALRRFRFGSALWKAAGACALIALCLFIQYLYVYKSGATERIYDAAGFGGGGQAKVKIDFLHVWSYFSSNIPLSLLASLLFPIVAFAAYRRELWDYDLVRYAAALMAVSVLIFATFKETGVREFQGNFAWSAGAGRPRRASTRLIR
jgi:hypothetical protein